MLLAVGLPTYLQVAYPVQPTRPVLDSFKVIEDLPAGSNVMIAMDYDPGSAPELHPMAYAFTRHLCERKCNLFFVTLWPGGGPLMDEVVNEVVLKEFKDSYAYGKNVVNLGYKPGLEVVIQVIATDLRAQFPTDKNGTPLDNMDVSKYVKSVQNMQLIASVSGGTPGAKEWIQYAGNKFNIPIVAGMTGVQATQLFPYYPNQMAGMLPAIKGAAEYETALLRAYPKYNDPGMNAGLRKMAPQLWGHLLMIALIILGNVIYFLSRGKGKSS